MNNALRPLPALQPRRCNVTLNSAGQPVAVDNHRVNAIREEWRVEQGWWSEPRRRRYLEVVFDNGRLRVIYEDRREPGTWWCHGS